MPRTAVDPARAVARLIIVSHQSFGAEASSLRHALNPVGNLNVLQTNEQSQQRTHASKQHKPDDCQKKPSKGSPEAAFTPRGAGRLACRRGVGGELGA